MSTLPRHALLLALAACGSPRPPHDAIAAPQPPQETPPVTRAAPAVTVLASATDTFEYKVGNPGFQGRTTVHVSGDGTAEVRRERGGKTETFHGTVPAAKLQALRDALATHPPASYHPPKRNAVPDEVTMSFTTVTGGARSEASILHDERYELPGLDELVELLQDIASTVSGGAIEY